MLRRAPNLLLAPSASRPGRQGTGRQQGLSSLSKDSRRPQGNGFAIDSAKVEADALFVLRTNTKITALQVVLRYRNLLDVEDAFKTAKGLLAPAQSSTRPTPAS
jgi:hypothetical protein